VLLLQRERYLMNPTEQDKALFLIKELMAMPPRKFLLRGSFVISLLLMMKCSTKVCSLFWITATGISWNKLQAARDSLPMREAAAQHGNKGKRYTTGANKLNNAAAFFNSLATQLSPRVNENMWLAPTRSTAGTKTTHRHIHIHTPDNTRTHVEELHAQEFKPWCERMGIQPPSVTTLKRAMKVLACCPRIFCEIGPRKCSHQKTAAPSPREVR
jgi:hypothetical protein